MTQPSSRATHRTLRVTHALLLLTGLSALTACSGKASARHSRGDAAGASRVHTYVSPPAGLLANAYIVETDSNVIIVDATLTVSDGRRLRARVDSLSKPIAAVLITHGHPDHYNGLTELLRGVPNVPIYATAGVDRVIRDWDARKEQQWKGTFGDEWPSRRTFPNRIVRDGETIVVDGVRFTAHDLGPGESHHDSYWTVEDRDGAYVFVGDLVFNGEHSYVSDGHTTEWLGHLDRLRRPLEGMRLFPGHGPAGGVEVLGKERQYLAKYRREVERVAQGRAQLTEAEKNELTRSMTAFLPDAKLTFLIGIGADAVAHEMANARSRSSSRWPQPADLGRVRASR